MTCRPVEASTPTRVDLAGGTLDIWPISQIVPGALTVNLAVELRARARVEPRRDGRVLIISRDRRLRESCRLPLAFRQPPGRLAFLWGLVAAFRPEAGLTLTCEALAPAGSGLGGSSALGIAVGAALDRFLAEGLRREDLVRRVMNVETVDLGVPTGDQDYLAALHGGLAAYHHGFDGTIREKLRIPAGLQERLVLAYTGQPRKSGFSNWDMFKRTVERDRVTERWMRAIARVARDLRAALQDGDLDAAGRLLGEEGRLRYRLAPTVATSKLLAVDAAARGAGAPGAKVCGAGGGGCLVAIAPEGGKEDVARAMAAAGARVLDARFARRGLRVSEPRSGS